jgi:hypothetical protein
MAKHIITGQYIVGNNKLGEYTITCSCAYCTQKPKFVLTIHQSTAFFSRWYADIHSNNIEANDYDLALHVTTTVAGCLGKINVLSLFLVDWPRSIMKQLSSRKRECTSSVYWNFTLKTHYYLVFWWVLQHHLVTDIVKIIMGKLILCDDGIVDPNM